MQGAITQDVIQEAVAILVSEAQPLQVILFGSHARGDASPDSDVDFLVVEREIHDTVGEMNRLRDALRPLRIPVDVLVTTEAHLASSWADFPGTYLYDALHEGKVMYAMDRTGAPVAAQVP